MANGQAVDKFADVVSALGRLKDATADLNTRRDALIARQEALAAEADSVQKALSELESRIEDGEELLSEVEHLGQLIESYLRRIPVEQKE